MKKSNLIEIRDYKIEVITNGVKEFSNIVLCLHGFNGDKWGDAYDGLRHIMTNSLVVSFDSCGHGHSEVLSSDMRLDLILEEIDVVMNYLREEAPNKPIVLVGVSYGGYRVMEYLIKYKPEVNKVIYINPAFKILEILEMCKEFNYKELKEGEKVYMKRSLNKFMSKSFLDDLHENNLYSKTYELNYDSEVVIGKRDTLIPEKDILEIAEKYGYKVTYVDEGHNLENEENWRVVADIIGA